MHLRPHNIMKQGDTSNVLGSVRPFDCLSALSRLNHLTLIFGMGFDLDLS